MSVWALSFFATQLATALRGLLYDISGESLASCMPKQLAKDGKFDPEP